MGHPVNFIALAIILVALVLASIVIIGASAVLRGHEDRRQYHLVIILVGLWAAFIIIVWGGFASVVK